MNWMCVGVTVLTSWSAIGAAPETSGIEDTVRMYHKGADERNTDLLRKALHEKFRLVVTIDGKLSEIRKDMYVNLIELEKIGGKPRSLEIEVVDLSGDAAVVKAKMTGKGAVFVDYLSLVRDAGRWSIISNTPHIYPRSKR